MTSQKSEELFERWLHTTLHEGRRLDPASLIEELARTGSGVGSGRSALEQELETRIEEYDRLRKALGDSDDLLMDEPAREDPGGPLPAFSGFETLEALGRGGFGEVYRARDRRLGRDVAIKILRVDRPASERTASVLQEARIQALFEDPRFARVYELRQDAERELLVMELGSGYPLVDACVALDWGQKARVLARTAEAIAKAHALGVQHRDLKPDNVLVGPDHQPTILDFGLARTHGRAEGLGTPPYAAPELAASGAPIDARCDVYALGAMLYETLCGRAPKAADERVGAAALERPREIAPDVPPALEAIALVALEIDPARRYEDAAEMARDLRRFEQGRRVAARPSQYDEALALGVREHLDAVDQWRQRRLIYPHEQGRIARAYDRLLGREEDWIVEGRALRFSRLVLYVGALALACGAALLLDRAVRFEVASGLAPTVLLTVAAVLSWTASRLYRDAQRAVAVAYLHATTVLVPAGALGFLVRTGIFDGGLEGALFEGWGVTDLQLQCALATGAAWTLQLARKTRTIGLSTAFASLAALMWLSLLASFGLRTWIEEAQWDRLGVGLLPLVLLAAACGWLAEQRKNSWMSTPMFLLGAVSLVLALELTALDGRATRGLGITLTSAAEGTELSSETLLDTVVAMVLFGLLFYVVGHWLDGSTGESRRRAGAVLLFVAPFAILKPLWWLVATAEYSRLFDWLLLVAALAAAFVSRIGERRSFLYAGVYHVVLALWLLTQHYGWWGSAGWSVAVLAGGGALLAVGYWLEKRPSVSVEQPSAERTD